MFKVLAFGYDCIHPLGNILIKFCLLQSRFVLNERSIINPAHHWGANLCILMGPCPDSFLSLSSEWSATRYQRTYPTKARLNMNHSRQKLLLAGRVTYLDAICNHRYTHTLESVTLESAIAAWFRITDYVSSCAKLERTGNPNSDKTLCQLGVLPLTPSPSLCPSLPLPASLLQTSSISFLSFKCLISPLMYTCSS